MKFLRRIAALVAFSIPWLSGCEGASSGGSQTNWVNCTTSAECASGEVCREKHCQPREGGVSEAASPFVRTSCVERLGDFWGECLAYESECRDGTASLHVVRTAICTGDGHALLSCTDPGGQRLQIAAKIPAFGGELPALTGCACDPKTGTARDADLKVAAEGVSPDDALGCRVDGVSVVKGSLGWGGDFATRDGGAPDHPYGDDSGGDAKSTCGLWYGTAMGGCTDFSVCFNGCTTSANCPAPESGNPTVDCAPLGGAAGNLGNACILHCDRAHACPDGMVCAYGAGMGDACMFPYAETTAGCP